MASVSTSTDYIARWNEICDQFSMTSRLPIHADGKPLEGWLERDFSCKYTTLFETEFASTIDKIVDLFRNFLSKYKPGTVLEIKVIAIHKAEKDSLPLAHPLVRLRYGKGLRFPFTIISEKIGELKVERRTIYYLEEADRPDFVFHRTIFPYAHQSFDRTLLNEPRYSYLAPLDVKDPENSHLHGYWHLSSNVAAFNERLKAEFSPEKL